MDSVLPILFGYGVGSLPIGFFIASRAKGIDLRRVGSGNVGAANAYRSIGLVVAVIVVLVDVAKGASSVFFAARFGAGADPVAAGIAAIVGHVYPVWLRFHGGKGVATACGVFWMLAPLATAISATVFIVVVSATRYVSLGSVVATLLLPLMAWITAMPMPVCAGAALAAGVIVQRHRANLARLHQGIERRLGR